MAVRKLATACSAEIPSNSPRSTRSRIDSCASQALTVVAPTPISTAK